MPPAVPQHLVKKAIRARPGPPASVLTNSTVSCPEQSELGVISLVWTRHRDLPQVWRSSPSPCHRDPDTSRHRVLKLPPDRYPQPTSQGRPAHCPGYPATPPQLTRPANTQLQGPRQVTQGPLPFSSSAQPLCFQYLALAKAKGMEHGDPLGLPFISKRTPIPGPQQLLPLKDLSSPTPLHPTFHPTLLFNQSWDPEISLWKEA
ncbi:unnamed protein product [Rangifer tarandus platyrhynchus]|uniref:Uncharacterized protein n=1 Tax=Rangifer tarandus platyrhynchus TaxID=3082113 RepID=A0AC59YCX3_RANTA